jgi:pSer/pThr/pTyr-binding forkhead associated (FHA) protein
VAEAWRSTPTELKAQIEAARLGTPFLVFRDGERTQRILVLTEARAHSVGRDPANEIALPWDTEVSRLHAELAPLGTEWTIVDDGLSRNGTYVNGHRISARRRLNDRDAIRFGRTEMVFRSPAAAAALEETKQPAGAGVPPELTPAQRRVLIALCRPWAGGAEHVTPATNRQIADELVVGIDAVKANLRALFDKFAVEDLPQNRKRARLVELAFERGAVRRQDLEP